jgi:asparagine synthase (glutamine-hydrolysing)
VSALAGCYWFGRVACSDDLQPCTTAAAHRAGGEFRYWSSGPVAVAHADRWRSASAGHGTPQDFPAYDPLSRTTVVVDGVVDNIDELAGTLGVQPTLEATVRAAFQRWSAESCSRLLGDFVVVVYDESARRLTCVRDPLGQRPLFYGVSSRGIVIGSEAQQVVRHPAIRRDINEGMIAEHLADAPSTVGETHWKNVYRLPPAHALEIDSKGYSVRRYWNFDPGAQVRHANGDQYADHFLDLFTRAVECRLQTPARQPANVGVLLSGGIDSSSIAGVAQALRQASGETPIHALSATFPNRSCDESAFIDAVVEKWRLPAARADVVIPAVGELREDVNRYLDLSISPGSTADVLRRQAAAMGVDVLLTGCGGDDYFSGSPLALAAMLRRGQVIRAARAAVNPLLSDRARRVLRPMFGARPPKRPWIRPEFRTRVSLDERLAPAPVPPFPTREQRDMYRLVSGLFQIIGDEIEDRAAHATGVLQRHPFYDRRVAEFGLALPPDQRFRDGRHKIVIRRALRDFLPPAIAARADKAEFSFTYIEALESLGGAKLLGKLRSDEAGWVDGDVARNMYRHMIDLYRRASDGYIELTGPLWAIVSLEMWLEQVEAS